MFTEIQERNRLLTEAEQESDHNSDPRPGKKPKNIRSLLSDEENDLIQELDDNNPPRARTLIEIDDDKSDDLPLNKPATSHFNSDQEDEATQDGSGVQDHESDSFMSNGVTFVCT